MRSALTEAFSSYGGVNNIRLPTDRETGELKGIGFIEFATAEAKVGGDEGRLPRGPPGPVAGALRAQPRWRRRGLRHRALHQQLVVCQECQRKR